MPHSLKLFGHRQDSTRRKSHTCTHMTATVKAQLHGYVCKMHLKYTWISFQDWGPISKAFKYSTTKMWRQIFQNPKSETLLSPTLTLIREDQTVVISTWNNIKHFIWPFKPHCFHAVLKAGDHCTGQHRPAAVHFTDAKTEASLPLASLAQARELFFLVYSQKLRHQWHPPEWTCLLNFQLFSILRESQLSTGWDSSDTFMGWLEWSLGAFSCSPILWHLVNHMCHTTQWVAKLTHIYILLFYLYTTRCGGVHL